MLPILITIATLGVLWIVPALIATRLIRRDEELPPKAKLFWRVVVWLVPIFGALSFFQSRAMNKLSRY
ncbi:MAG: hypothetical protein KJ043_06590 [Anaerolineae bacterium]|nr:hypothetical protein [Anaerolineae bacterium]